MGVMLFQQNAYIYFGLIMAVTVWIYVYKTRFGLALRMVGENPSGGGDRGHPRYGSASTPTSCRAAFYAGWAAPV